MEPMSTYILYRNLNSEPRAIKLRFRFSGVDGSGLKVFCCRKKPKPLDPEPETLSPQAPKPYLQVRGQ